MHQFKTPLLKEQCESEKIALPTRLGFFAGDRADPPRHPPLLHPYRLEVTLT